MYVCMYVCTYVCTYLYVIDARLKDRAHVEMGPTGKTVFRTVDGKANDSGWTDYAYASARPFRPSKLPARFGKHVPHWQEESRGT